jgi:hypothetical protein
LSIVTVHHDLGVTSKPRQEGLRMIRDGTLGAVVIIGLLECPAMKASISYGMLIERFEHEVYL